MSNELLIEKKSNKYIENLSNTHLRYTFDKEDQMLFFEYKKYILLKDFDVENIEDEDSLNQIIQNKNNRDYLNWKGFMKVLLLNYPISSIYNEVLYKLKLYDYPIYSQMFQIKECMDIQFKKIIIEYFGGEDHYVLSPVFIFYAFNYVSSKKDLKKVIKNYLKLPLYLIYQNLLNCDLTEEERLDYLHRLANKEIKDKLEDYPIQLKVKVEKKK